MKEGRLKRLLYKTGIIPMYGRIQKKYYSFKESPDRWYFIFLPIKNNKIVFDSLFGKGYGDDPKAIAELLLNSDDSWDIVWLAYNPISIPEGIRYVKYGSRQAMKELASAKFWVFNARGVKHPKKRKKQVYLQTWHALFPFKYIEKEAHKKLSTTYVEAAKKDGAICDAVISGCSVMSKIMKDSFWLNSNAEILEYGIPTDDVFFNEIYKENIKKQIRLRYGIGNDELIVLYMPTFRDDDSINCYCLEYNSVIKCFENKFKKKCRLIVRFHPNVNSKKIQIPEDKCIDVSDYLIANDILICADYLISDYSGMIMSFALLDKPVFLFSPDLEKYSKTRGLNKCYYDLPLLKAKTNTELISNISAFNREEYYIKWYKYKHTIDFFDDGKASIRVVEWLKSKR